MTIETIRVLEMLAKLQKSNLNPEINIFDGDCIINFNDIHGRYGCTESVTITKEGVWKGYGWNFDELMNLLEDI